MRREKWRSSKSIFFVKQHRECTIPNYVLSQSCSPYRIPNSTDRCPSNPIGDFGYRYEFGDPVSFCNRKGRNNRRKEFSCGYGVERDGGCRPAICPTGFAPL